MLYAAASRFVVISSALPTLAAAVLYWIAMAGFSHLCEAPLKLAAEQLSRNGPSLLKARLGGQSRSHQKQRATLLPGRRPQMSSHSDYFRLAAAVRSNLPVTTKLALHQLEPKPPGLIGVKLAVKVAVWSLVNALQSPLFKSVSK